MADVIKFLGDHSVLILSILLGISETLGLFIPSIGGFLGGLNAVLKQLGAKDTQAK